LGNYKQHQKVPGCENVTLALNSAQAGMIDDISDAYDSSVRPQTVERSNTCEGLLTTGES
jgi:hypothetical protein